MTDRGFGVVSPSDQGPLRVKLPPESILLPYESAPYRMQMGLQARDPLALVEIDDRYPEQMVLRRDLLDGRRAEVFGAVPGSEAARAEVLERLATLLPGRHPDWFDRTGDTLHNRLTGETWDLAVPALDRLEVAGRLVQEDLCIVTPGPDGPVLAAAVLCFPTSWRLAEKLGHPLAAVHGPVPFYAERLAAPVDRLMDRLLPGRMVERVNWSLATDPALFQPYGKGRADAAERVTVANAGETLFLRTERQTLSRLAASNALLFGIRVRVHALAVVCARAGEAARLLGAIRALPEEMLRYKGLLPFRDALVEWLRRRPG